MTEHDGGSVERFTPSYELSEESRAALTYALLSRKDIERVPEQYPFVTVELDGHSRFSNIARHIERVEFEKRFGNNTATMEQEYGPYEAASRFFLTIDRSNGVACGALRIIEDSPAGLKTLNDVTGEDFQIDIDHAFMTHGIEAATDVWDVATVAVPESYQGGKQAISVRLYRAMYVSSINHGIKHLVSLVDDRALRNIKDRVGIPFIPFDNAKPGPYLGSPLTHAVYEYLPDFPRDIALHRQTSRLAQTVLKEPLELLADGIEDESIVLTSA